MIAIWIFALCLMWGILTIWVQGWWAWSLFQIAIFLLAAWRIGKTSNFRPAPIDTALAAAAAWPLVQLAVTRTVNRGETWVAALNWWTFLIVFLLAVSLCESAGTRRPFLRAIVLAGAALAALSVAQYYSSAGKIFWIFPSGYADGVLGPFVNRDQYAAWVELLLPASLYMAATGRRAALYGVAAAVLLGSVIAGASRAGSALALAEVLGVALALAARRSASRKTLTRRSLQFVLLAAVAIAVAGWQGLRDRIVGPASEVLRVDAVRASVAMVWDRPWTGSGLGTWPEMYPRYAGLDTGVKVNQAHNDWAQWAAEGGLPFLGIMLVFAALLCRPAVRSIFGLGVAAFLLHALVDFPMQQRPALAAWFFAIAGAATGRME